MIFRIILFATILVSASAQCSVCGEGKKTTTPDAVFNFPGQPAIPCGILESSGCLGLVPVDQCAQLSAIIGAFGCTCGVGDACATAPNPTAAPASFAPVTDPTPAPVDPTPAPVDPTPAPVDPTPAPIFETSAPATFAPVVTSAPVTSIPVLTQAPVTSAPAPVPAPTPAPVPISGKKKSKKGKKGRY